MCIRDSAYADDINIMSRRIAAAKEIFLELKNKTKEVGLAINIDKTPSSEIIILS